MRRVTMKPHSIRIPEGWGVLDMRAEGTALPQDAIRNGIACTPANWCDIYGRAVYRDGRGNEFCVERRPAGGSLPVSYVYLVRPVETEDDAEQEPFLHTLEEAAYA
jgi:hypothetical protein